MANNTKKKKGIICAIYSFLFCPTGSSGVKQLKNSVASLIQNQNLQQAFIDSNTQANNIIHIHLAKNRHMKNGLVGALKCINIPA